MYDKVKELVQTKPYLCMGIVIVLIGVAIAILVSPSGRADRDYHDSINTVERIESQQRKSLDLNQGVQDAVDRSTELNNQAAERIERIESYQQRAKERIDESQKRLDDAERLLERNEQIFRDVESRPQAEQGDRNTP